MFFYYNVYVDRPIKIDIEGCNYLYKTDQYLISIKPLSERVEHQAIEKFKIENRKGKILFCSLNCMVLFYIKKSEYHSKYLTYIIIK